MTWFIALPLAVQISVGVSFILLIGVLGFLGKINLKIGKNIISFGRGGKRSCGDCILLMLSKRERHDAQREFITNRVLKDQMNFAEQKILQVQGIFLGDYIDLIYRNRSSDSRPTEENKQYRLYQGILGNALVSVKDELRRSFKENGFDNLSGVEFTAYVKNKIVSLMVLGKDHVTNMYPYEGMIVSNTDRLEMLKLRAGILEDICFELFVKAKEIKKDAHDKVVALDKEFAEEMNEFLVAKD